MRLTNNLGLPGALVAAVAADDYSRGAANISVTSLIGPPRQVALINAHGDDLEEDASDRIFSLFGRAIHKILEDAGTNEAYGAQTIRESRMFMTVPGPFGDWVLSGAMDSIELGLLEDGSIGISDWKTAKTDEMIYGVKAERAAQLNVYAMLAMANGYKVGRLRDVFILRDWSKIRAAQYSAQPTLTGAPDPSAYPQSQVVVHEIEMWPFEQTRDYILERLALHQKAQTEYAEFVSHGYVNPQAALPDCTDDERWASKPVYAVTEPGASKATRVLDTLEEAEAYASEHTTPFEYDIREKDGKFGVWKGPDAKRASKVFDTHAEAFGWMTAQGKTFDIVPRPGRSTRCVFYCAVSSICSQFKEMQAA